MIDYTTTTHLFWQFKLELVLQEATLWLPLLLYHLGNGRPLSVLSIVEVTKPDKPEEHRSSQSFEGQAKYSCEVLCASVCISSYGVAYTVAIMVYTWAH